ncbi:uncharacterized protein METZ01_LOCUS422546 [marine metagenome]|jgi:type II secretory pathway pseudopilin PulG|uniref:Prepilin-type N-terminal cleavage/methylation domain-containing protein n=1 Tax=marine metagenome TaxID=408172 RepID=A0A382XF54_9ZZZZ
MKTLSKQTFTLIELLAVIAIMSMNNSAGLF